jgi:hypothetical protein
MNYLQDISWYRYGYLEKDMEKRESPHYLFHFGKETLASRDIDDIIRLKESHHEKITRWLGAGSNKKIDYYIYPDIKEKLLLMGDDAPGNVIWEELVIDEKGVIPSKFEIHVVYNERCKFVGEHEDTHLLSLPWGLSIYLFCEGLAQFMEDGFMGEELHIVSKRLRADNRLYPIVFLCSNHNWEKVDPAIIYPEVGSFTRFLIDKYSKERFEEVYRSTSRHHDLVGNMDRVERVYGKDISRLESEWLDYID